PGRGEPAVGDARGAVDGRSGARADPVLDGLDGTQGHLRVLHDEAPLRRHRFAGEETLHEVEGLFEGRRTLLDVGAHGEELRLAIAQTALEDEAAARDGGQGADLLGDEHGVPQGQEKEAARGLVVPLREQPAHHGHVLVVNARRRVVIAHEERVEAGALRGGRALDHPARALVRILDSVAARERDAESHRVSPTACRTAWVVMGRSVNRCPVASLTALAMAAGAATTGGSPTPLAPKGPCSDGTSTSTARTGGTCSLPGMA